MTILKPFKILGLFFLLAACGGQEEVVEPDFYETLFSDAETGIFRGLSIGDTPKEVQAQTKLQPTLVTDSLLTYNLRLPHKTDTVSILLYYAFDSFGLFEIQVDMYPRNKTWMDMYISQIELGLTDSFGRTKRVGDTRTWTTVSEANNEVEITLGVDYDDDDNQFLSLNILEPLDDEL